MSMSRFFQPTSNDVMCSQSNDQINIFVRQPLTQTDWAEKEKIQIFMQWLNTKPIHLLLGQEAKSDSDFRLEFESLTGLPFTPDNFRTYRLNLLRHQTDGFVFYWGKGLSVSGGFEVGFLYALQDMMGEDIPLFFAIADPIKTTLLRELPGATYCPFSDLKELDKPFELFLQRVQATKTKRLERVTAMMKELDILPENVSVSKLTA